MDIRLIRMFNRALPGKDLEYSKIAEIATKSGYIVDPVCATQDVLKFLREQKINPNSTFYKTWTDITSKSRFELYLDQMRHYASTYGTVPEATLLQSMTDGTVNIDYNVNGNGYVPNENPVVIDWTKFKVIKAATSEEIRDLILEMFKSGAAMSADTIDACIGFLKNYKFLDNIDIDEIKNKEAQTIIAVELKKYPSDEFGLLRAIVYTYTGSAMLIKSRSVINTIKGVNGFSPKERFDFALLSERQLVNLSRIFLRYKPLFLAMKGYADNATYINKIRRLAEKHHTPLKKGFWEDCMVLHEGTTAAVNLEKARNSIKELNNFRKVQIMQSIMGRLNGKNMDGRIYIIRNGHMYIREDYKPTVNQSYLMDLYNVVKTALIESLKEKKTTFYIPESLHIACPTSEKNFLGNYPIGTSVDFESNDNVIGVYWRNEWGTRDFDLHVVDEKGRQFGWNSMNFNSSREVPDIIYSGDMTNADPEATELFYFRKNVPDGFVNLNKFNGQALSKFRLFVAKENLTRKLLEAGRSSWEYRNFGNHYKKIMVDPNNIVFEAMLDFNDGSQQTIAYLHNSRIYLMQLTSGNSRVTSRANNEIIQQANKVKADSYIDLAPILEEAGFKRLISAKDATVVDNSKEKELLEKFKIFEESTRTAGFAEVVVERLIKEAKENLDKNLENLKADKQETSTESAELDFSAPTKEMLLKLFA